MNKFQIKDSGNRTEFETGAVRDLRAGKGRFDLIPPRALFRVARHYEAGAAKYGDNNWQKGIPAHNYIDSALRHINSWRCGDDEEDHLAAAVWNLLCLIETEERIEEGTLPAELMDIEFYRGESGG